MTSKTTVFIVIERQYELVFEQLHTMYDEKKILASDGKDFVKFTYEKVCPHRLPFLQSLTELRIPYDQSWKGNEHTEPGSNLLRPDKDGFVYLSEYGEISSRGMVSIFDIEEAMKEGEGALIQLLNSHKERYTPLLTETVHDIS